MKGFLLACAVAASAICVAQASADSSGQHVAGAVAYTQNGGAETFTVSARSDAGGVDPTGHITLNAIGQGTFHGDVSQGCLRETGNHAVVVGLLPASEQFMIPSGRVIRYVALFVEDNGQPVGGQPTDRVATLLMSDALEQIVCAGGQPAALATVPVERGNVIVD